MRDTSPPVACLSGAAALRQSSGIARAEQQDQDQSRSDQPQLRAGEADPRGTHVAIQELKALEKWMGEMFDLSQRTDYDYGLIQTLTHIQDRLARLVGEDT